MASLRAVAARVLCGAWGQAAQVEARIAQAVFQTIEAVMITDARARILRVNQAFIDNMGYEADEVIGQTPKMLQSGRHDEAFYRAMFDTIARSGQWQGEVWDRRKNGEIFPKWMTITAVKDSREQTTHYVATYIDITERKQAQEQIRKLAFYDGLTGLPNRTLMWERMRQAMASSATGAQYGALLLVDLDHFRTLNDTLGHSQGDVLLQHAGQRIGTCVAAKDTVARIGGDEFVVILPSLGGQQDRAAARAEAVGQGILEMLGHDFQLDQTRYVCSASIGIVLFYELAQDPAILLKQAELAMYQAKSDGRNRLHFFDVILEHAITERVGLERDLREGIGSDQLILHYQPQVRVDASGTRVMGAEALVRWNHPQRGLLGPDQFIALAEETGLIQRLGSWVLETACQRLSEWRQQAQMAALTLAINVSASQFLQDGFAAMVLSALSRTGCDPRRLKIELTESLLLGNVQTAIGIMDELRSHGLQFSLDDFGTGYSSLAYLKRLPLDQLKIDQSFVHDLPENRHDAAIARSVIALATGLGLAVIAEGVESIAQRDFLQSLGCQDFQGFCFSQPLPEQAFEAYVRCARLGQ